VFFPHGLIILIANLQVLRAMAALGVVIYHTRYEFVRGVHTDLQGVAVFFVISGFIMCFITRDGHNSQFLANRFIRIVPMYWLFTLLMFFLHRLSPMAINQPTVADLPASLMFLPSEQLPVLGVGWTLNFEVYFYLVFGSALLINWRFAPLITVAFIYTVFALDQRGYGGFLAHYYSHDYIHYFIVGIAIYYLWTFGAAMLRGWPVIAVCSAGLLFFLVSQFSMQQWPAWLLPYYTWLPGLVVACALFLESCGGRIAWRPLLLMGDASYSLYLSHSIILSIANKILQAFWPSATENFAVVVFEILIAVLTGIAAHLYLEKPLLREIRNISGGNKKIRPDRHEEVAASIISPS
jgi:exopolysaccharide production protein ExoZ